MIIRLNYRLNPIQQIPHVEQYAGSHEINALTPLSGIAPPLPPLPPVTLAIAPRIMVDHLRSDAAQMAALFVEAVLYGIYLVSLCFVLIYILRDGPGRWRMPSGIRAVTLTVALILGINSTLNIGWGLTRQLRTYIFNPQMKKATWIDLAKVRAAFFETRILPPKASTALHSHRTDTDSRSIPGRPL